jgi:hypothetical protein
VVPQSGAVPVRQEKAEHHGGTGRPKVRIGLGVEIAVVPHRLGEHELERDVPHLDHVVVAAVRPLSEPFGRPRFVVRHLDEVEILREFPQQLELAAGTAERGRRGGCVGGAEFMVLDHDFSIFEPGRHLAHLGEEGAGARLRCQRREVR